VHAVQLSTPVVSLMPVDACVIRKITACPEPTKALTMLAQASQMNARARW
jgi:hypothetical protein